MNRPALPGICDITVVYDDYTFTTAFRPMAGGTASCAVAVTWFDFMAQRTNQTLFMLVGAGV